MSVRTESKLMALCRRAGMDRLAWALRRFHCPVPADALVLEVGSGGNPYPRANVLLDAYEDTRERHWAPLVRDRPTVLGFVENLPFRDKAFDYVIAAHVLEHSTDPARFLGELERVAHAGYIEVPDAFMERVNPYRDHRLEITSRAGTLVLRKKTAWRHDPELVELYEDRVKPFLTGELMRSRPFQFHVRHYWQNRISFHIVNPDANANWPAPETGALSAGTSRRTRLRDSVRDGLRLALSQNRRNARISLDPLLRCPNCHGETLLRSPKDYSCADCGSGFPVRGRVVYMNQRQVEQA